MIKYDRLWKFMKEHQVSQYHLVVSGISHSTLARLKRDQSVSIDTIDKLCGILQCNVEDIMEYQDTNGQAKNKD